MAPRLYFEPAGMPAPPLAGLRRPNLSLLADRCGSLRALAPIHAAMLVSGRLASDAFAASRLLAAYAALSPSPDAVLRFHSSLPYAPNSFMHNTTIRALASSPDPAAAFPFFSLIRRRAAFSPGRHTFPFLLKAASACLSSVVVRVSEQLHGLSVKHGLELDEHVANGLVRAYSVAGFVGVARKVFDELPERGSMVYTTMVSGYAQNACYEEAVGTFVAMVHEGLELREAALASVLSACARSGSAGLEMGRRVHELMQDRRMTVPLNAILGTALVDMYAKNGAIMEAVAVFEGMPERLTATWSALISGLAHHGHVNRALAVFRQMSREGVPPNGTTLVGVLSAYCRAGLLEEARRVFDSMEKNFGVTPSVQHYCCMVDLLGQQGILAEAEEMIRGMACEPDIVIWGALLTACKNQGDIAAINVAERTVQEILKLDPSNHGGYVVLSNMYAEAGRWQDVDRLRKAIKGSKIPGSSTIGSNGGH